MAKVGLYFGSFNPVHIGHMAIAGYITEFTDIDQVWFVVSPQNPLKKKDSLLADHHRLQMVRLAIGDNDYIKACDIEFKLPVPSYTIDTLTYLREKHSNNKFCLVMGEDNLCTFHKWKNASELASGYPIYVYPRVDSKMPDSQLLKELLSRADIHYIKAPVMQISGTFIRDGIKKGRNMSYFLSAPVWKYIEEMHFYEK